MVSERPGRPRGRPTNNLRVPDLDPHVTTLAFVRACLEHGRRYAVLLGPALTAHEATDEVLASTKLYRRVRRLVDYAVTGTALRVRVGELVAPLEPLATSPLWERSDLERVLASVDTQLGNDSAMKLVLLAAFARERLEDGKPVTSSELAVLGGLTRPGVLAAIKQGSLACREEGRPGTGGSYVIDAKEAQRWLAARGTTQVAVPPPARRRRGTTKA